MTSKHIISELLEKLDISYRWVDHPPAFTVADSANILVNKTPIKNLLLQEQNGDQLFLVVMAGLERLDMKATARRLSVNKLHFASAETLLKTMHVTPGSVSIFGLIYPESNNISVVIDAQLMNSNELGFHPNDNTATVFIPNARIENILRHTGHRYKIMNLY